MGWYHYRQNNSGGSFSYSEYSGISVNVWIEADNAILADERAQAIGLYFDGDGDCSCCGDRWYPKASYWNDDPELEDPPQPEETMKRDEFDSWSGRKWRADGEYETFVHPVDKEFYGAHATVETVRKLTYGEENGYGFVVHKNSVSETYPVSELGWDKTGNHSAPAPGYQYYRPEDGEFYENEVGMRIEHIAAYEYARVWSPTEELADKAIVDINAYLDTTPRPNAIRKLFKLYEFDSFVPVNVSVFDEDDDV